MSFDKIRSKIIARLEKAGTSPVLFHGTTLGNAAKILTSNKFYLTFARGASIEDKMTGDNDYHYYFSCARNRNSRYIETDAQVIFELDGRKLGYNLKSVPLDYWGQEMRRHDNWRSEQEDRLLSKKPTIDNALKYVKSISAYVHNKDSLSPWQANRLKDLVDAAEKTSIPFYFYDNQRDMMLNNKKKAMSLSDAALFANQHEYKDDSFRDPRDYQIHEVKAPVIIYNLYKEALAKNKLFSDLLLTEIPDQELRRQVERYNSYMMHDFVQQFTANIQNSRKNMNDEMVKAIDDFSRLLRKLKLHNIKDFFGVINDLKQEYKVMEDKVRRKKSLEKMEDSLREKGVTYSRIDVENEGDGYENITVNDLKMKDWDRYDVLYNTMTLANTIFNWFWNLNSFTLNFSSNVSTEVDDYLKELGFNGSGKKFSTSTRTYNRIRLEERDKA